MTKRRRSALVATSLLAGCGTTAAPPAPTVTAAPKPVDAAVAPPSVSNPATALARNAVFADAFVPATLYTWTTPAQIEEMRRTRRLLLHEQSQEHGAAYVEH